jgi:hypothetical protein
MAATTSSMLAGVPGALKMSAPSNGARAAAMNIWAMSSASSKSQRPPNVMR